MRLLDIVVVRVAQLPVVRWNPPPTAQTRALTGAFFSSSYRTNKFPFMGRQLSGSLFDSRELSYFQRDALGTFERVQFVPWPIRLNCKQPHLCPAPWTDGPLNSIGMRRGWLIGGHGNPRSLTVRFDIYEVHPRRGPLA